MCYFCLSFFTKEFSLRSFKNATWGAVYMPTRPTDPRILRSWSLYIALFKSSSFFCFLAVSFSIIIYVNIASLLSALSASHLVALSVSF